MRDNKLFTVKTIWILRWKINSITIIDSTGYMDKNNR